MKQYKKVELIAKNSSKGSYVAGCPVNGRGTKFGNFILCGPDKDLCVECERTH